MKATVFLGRQFSKSLLFELLFYWNITDCTFSRLLDEVRHGNVEEVLDGDIVDDNLQKISREGFLILVAGCDDRDWVHIASRLSVPRRSVRLLRKDSISRACVRACARVFESWFRRMYKRTDEISSEYSPNEFSDKLDHRDTRRLVRYCAHYPRTWIIADTFERPTISASRFSLFIVLPLKRPQSIYERILPHRFDIVIKVIMKLLSTEVIDK